MSMKTYKIKNFEEKYEEKYGNLRNDIFNNFEIHWHEELSSTMDLVNKNISSKENLNHIIVSNYQRDGHGRYKRKWYSEKNKNLLASLPFLVGKELSPRMPIILSLSIFETIKEFVSDDDQLKIKWPNDILLNSKKISGMITENVVEGEKVYINFGVGININLEENDLFDKNFLATSLLIEKSKIHSLEEVLYVLLCKISKNLDYKQELFNKWKNYLYFPKKKIYLNNNKNEEYSVKDVDEFGNLIVHKNNKILKISYGEISFQD